MLESVWGFAFQRVAKTLTRLRVVLGEADQSLLELGLKVLGQGTVLVDLLEQSGLVALQVRQEVGLPLLDLGDGHVVEDTVDTGVDEGNHLVDGHGAVLLLLEQLDQALTTGQRLLGGGVQIGTELGKGSNLTVLGQEELKRTSDLLHRLELGSGADTRHGKTDVDGGTHTLVEELSLQEDLAVGNGNDVGGNVGRHVTTLGLDDGQRGERATAVLVAHLGGTLQETRVEVENVAGVSLTPGRTTEQQRHLTVGDGLLGQIVVDDNSVLAIITEVFTD